MAGRSNRDVHFWMEHLAKYQGSELTLGEYCRRENIGVHQFYCWRKRLSTTKMDQKSARAVLQSGTGRIDFATVLLHELGHTLGLEHLEDSDSLMSDYLLAGKRKALSADLIDQAIELWKD